MAKDFRALSPRAVLTAPPAQRQHILRRFWLPAVLFLALAAGGLTGIIAAYELNYSRAANEVAALATYRPSVVTRVYAGDGETVIGEFALEKRIPLKYEEIPPLMKNAILAVEDARFYDHMGIDPIRIIGATWKNLTSDKVEGGSTLTQQLAKNLFLSKEQTLKRKMNEWALALQIERYYTKNQIMELYANHIFLGANAYGVEAGAETYFGKQAKDLTIGEAALLAGVPKAPSEYSPTSNPARAKERRDLVLDLMAKNGFATPAEVDAAKAKPIQLADTAYYQSQPKSSAFDYPVEYVRQELEDKYTTRVAQGGLSVYTTINVEAQKRAYEVMRAGLRRYDQTHSGWRSSYKMIPTSANNGQGPPTTQEINNYKDPDWYGNDYQQGRYLSGLITKVDHAKNEAIVRFGNYSATVGPADMGWSKRQPKDELKPGYLSEFEIKEVDKKSRRLKVELSQVPAVAGAMMTLNAKTGEMVTMIGGYDFYSTSKFNNATQAYRQTGSCFKPFIYTAAVEWGMTPDTTVSGAPISIGSWQPHNYDGSLGNGDLPLKMALAKSMNVPAVHLLQTVGIQTGAQMLRRFGVKVPMAPYLPSALGATEVPLDQMVSAYSAFPNKGIRVEPHMIRRVLDRDGAVLEEWEKTTYKVVNEYVALTMVSMMRGVVQFGTAAAAGSLGVPLAGKTGTVNDHTDVWFIGYTPTYVTGVWMGYPGRKKPLGNEMTGAHGALPMFIDFMKDFLKGKPKEDFDKAPSMPEDMKELFRQRQRELAAERAQFNEDATKQTDEDTTTLPAANTQPKMEQMTLPPPPRVEEGPANAQPRGETVTPRVETPPPPPMTRPREVDPQKKKGKKGDDSPPG
ncbi:MAG TPA: penicillin-binding protein [Blastocatellia bacterium]|jgi:penicillin-binding protein 1A|nr:penicillin-binding protein [Blastocatellia bacterium]HAF24358.1 penicillin-binding protein [Blastocatellia bacterium]